MKNKLILIMSILLSVNLFAEENVVDISKLSPELQSQIETEIKKDNINAKLEQYTQYAEMGRGFGVAINESLSAITDNVEDFANTDAGKITIGLIAWKVAGKDAIYVTNTIIGYLVGFIIMIVSITVGICVLKRNVFKRSYLERIDSDGTKFFKIINHGKEQEEISGAWALGVVVFWIVSFLAVCMVLFS